MRIEFLELFKKRMAIFISLKMIQKEAMSKFYHKKASKKLILKAFKS
ncbi:hypothetical protein SAMN04488097_0993 [Epilithonimonas lactis]|nr:hypothetical protein SAMN04488097_0993 [Epilithonimonas lactis]